EEPEPERSARSLAARSPHRYPAAPVVAARRARRRYAVSARVADEPRRAVVHRTAAPQAAARGRLARVRGAVRDSALGLERARRALRRAKRCREALVLTEAPRRVALRGG